MSCFEYECLIPRNNCICALISRIPLSDTKMDYFRARAVSWGQISLISLELMFSKCNSGASQMMF